MIIDKKSINTGKKIKKKKNTLLFHKKGRKKKNFLKKEETGKAIHNLTILCTTYDSVNFFFKAKQKYAVLLYTIANGIYHKILLTILKNSNFTKSMFIKTINLQKKKKNYTVHYTCYYHTTF